MYIEDQYIQEQFCKNFVDGKKGNIVIYGTGIHTEKLLKSISSEKIAGLMDVQKTGQTLWGYRVFSYEEVAAIENVYIVILARNAVLHIIYRRIQQFCQERGIEVFDIRGNNLCQLSGKSGAQACFLLKEQELKERIQEVDIVTFDIFDTLLTRCIMRPRDIFELIEQSLANKSCHFAEERMRAESTFQDGDNPTLYEIYERFRERLGISAEETKQLLELEISFEKRFLKRREKMCEFLSYANALGKKVYLISDMYFTKEILGEILAGFHISGYQDILVSCEYRKSKQEGLFAHFQKEIAGEEKKCLHIGDNYYSDIVAAEKAGFCTYQIYSPIEMLESSLYSGIISENYSLEENIIISYFAVQAYQNPFGAYEKNGKLIFHTIAEMAEMFIAPIILKYMLWLVQNIREKGHELVIFPSRDGYLLKKIYDLFQKQEDNMPPPLYLYTSRRAALIAAVQNEADIQNIMEVDFIGEAPKMLNQRFGFETDRGHTLEEIKQHCEEERKNYVSYLDNTGFNQYESIAILDFVAVGTVQEALERLLNRRFMGYYFLKRRTDKSCFENLQCVSLYKMAGDFQNNENVYRFYYFLESIITSYEPTFWGVNQDGEKLFYPENREENELTLLRQIHDRILKYCGDVLKLLPDIFHTEGSVGLFDKILGFMSEEYSVLEEEVILKNVDEFMGRKVFQINR